MNTTTQKGRQPLTRFDVPELLKLIEESNNPAAMRLMARVAMEKINQVSDDELIRRAENAAETAWNERFLF